MATKRLNVLVYSGKGSTVESVRHCLFTLRRLLSPHYAITPVTGDALVKEPWMSSCTMLVMPGGADQGYCEILNGTGNRRIRQFVEQGGLYLGFCAGGYYGSQKCEFEVGNKYLEVIGDRELAFFPGICRGCAFKGFKYGSEAGARAAELKVNKSCLAVGAVPEVFRSYYNGGGVFVDALSFKDKGIEVLANYTEPINVDGGEGTAAVIYCKIGEGAAILTGPHPEFASRNLEPKPEPSFFPQVVHTLDDNDDLRNKFVAACLKKMGLEVNEEQNAVPPLSRLHLSSLQPGEISKILEELKEIMTVHDGEQFIKDENDVFRLEQPSGFSLSELKESLPEQKSKCNESLDGTTDTEDRILDYKTVVKCLVLYTKGHPSAKDTPYFNHETYFDYLESYQDDTPDSDEAFGSSLLYGEVVTSTNTLLEKNTQTLRRLPAGFTACATVQVAGRGRGSNVWISPSGSLMFSVLFHHPKSLMPLSPIVFLQYLAALAVVEGIHTYAKGYEKLPVKLKWPNDIYALDPSFSPPTSSASNAPPPPSAYVKIGGILVNSHYSSTTYHSVLGIGLNTTNSLPTTSLSALISALQSTLPATSPPLAPLTPERLLARLVTTLSALYTRFCRTGFDSYFESMYYKHWLHSEQVVTLEAEGGTRARIKGITRDWGLLVAEEILGGEDGVGRERVGRRIELQSDSNSFDFFRGLVRHKTQ